MFNKLVLFALLSFTCGAKQVLQLHRNQTRVPRQRPIVMSAADVVTLGQPTNGDGSNYVGSLRIGSEHDRVTVFYDTQSKHTSVVLKGAQRGGQITASRYDPNQSGTLKRVYNGTEDLTSEVKFMDTTLSGKVLRDQMCLIEDEFQTTQGYLCVKNQMFLGVNKIEGPFEINGIIGLGPQQADDENSIVHQLYDQTRIPGLKVGINFEDPFDPSLESTISFGFYVASAIKGDEDDLNWFPNAGTDSWAIEVISFTYDGIELSTKPGLRKAQIDTASLNFKLPEQEFQRVYQTLKQQDDTMYTFTDADALGDLIASRKNCADLAKILDEIQITLPGSVLQLKPHAYLWSYKGDNGCNIGFEKSKSEDYQLGTLFLRNFYVGLDYEFNSVLIGLNQQAVDVEIHGKSPNPYKKGPSVILVIVIFFLLTLVVVGVFCYVRAKKIDEDKRTVIFGREVAQSDSQVRRYKNGVEIKPSEYSAKERKELRSASDAKKKNVNINESRNLSESGSDSDDADKKPRDDSDEEAEQLNEKLLNKEEGV